jgi:soluble lytic murein transglycosylase-like protein
VLRSGLVMLFGQHHIVRYLSILVMAVCSIQYAILAEIRQPPRADNSRAAIDLEAVGSFSLMVDLIADSRLGLHGSFSIQDVEPIEAPRLDLVDGVASTLIFAEDDYLQELIQHYSDYYQVDPILISIIMEQESGYDPFALSSAGAMGLMQLMPDTAWMLGVEDPWNPEENIEGGVRYFSQQMDRFGRIEYALAAYNAGPGAVEKWGGVPPYPETVEYVNSIMGRYMAENEPVEAEEDVYYQEIRD